MKIEIFTGPGCRYCERAKALLAEHGLAYSERDVGQAEVRAEFAARLPREKAVPQVIIDGEHIGGCEDLELHLSGDARGPASRQ